MFLFYINDLPDITKFQYKYFYFLLRCFLNTNNNQTEYINDMILAKNILKVNVTIQEKRLKDTCILHVK